MRLSVLPCALIALLATFSTTYVSAEDRVEKEGASLPDDVAPQQKDWYEKYKTQENIPQPSNMLLNTDTEPALDNGFESLFNGKDLSGWNPKGGTCTFEVQHGMIVGTCVQGSDSTYLSTDRTDFKDFLFTCDIKWEIEGNTGVMFRAKLKKKGSSD